MDGFTFLVRHDGVEQFEGCGSFLGVGVQTPAYDTFAVIRHLGPIGQPPGLELFINIGHIPAIVEGSAVETLIEADPDRPNL